MPIHTDDQFVALSFQGADRGFAALIVLHAISLHQSEIMWSKVPATTVMLTRNDLLWKDPARRHAGLVTARLCRMAIRPPLLLQSLELAVSGKRTLTDTAPSASGLIRPVVQIGWRP